MFEEEEKFCEGHLKGPLCRRGTNNSRSQAAAARPNDVVTDPAKSCHMRFPPPITHFQAEIRSAGDGKL